MSSFDVTNINTSLVRRENSGNYTALMLADAIDALRGHIRAQDDYIKTLERRKEAE